MFTLGNFLTLSTFGESHGTAYGGILSNYPAGVKINEEAIQLELARRRPGQSKIVTQRQEEDRLEILSGIFEGVTTGTPLGFLIKNNNQKSADYSHLENTYRPSHADYTYDEKFGIRDHRGGGRSSARETVNWVAAGAFAKQLLPAEIEINAYTSSVGDIFCEKPYQALDFSLTETKEVRCPDEETAAAMISKIRQVKKSGDTIGGTVTCVLKNVPAGIGEPVFGKLQAELAHAMLSINAAKGFEYGSGFCGARMQGKEHNDLFQSDFSTKSNLSGGIQGGISNGMDIYFRVAFKPVATLMGVQQSVTKNGEIVDLPGRGRHDPCVVPRAVPIVENLAAFVLADLMLINKIRKI